MIQILSLPIVKFKFRLRNINLLLAGYLLFRILKTFLEKTPQPATLTRMYSVLRTHVGVRTLLSRRFICAPREIPSHGLINLSDESRFLQISGKDASTFINGLTTIKMIPQYIKKNQTTISQADLNNENIVKSITLTDNEITNTNWGIIHEDEHIDLKDELYGVDRIGIRRDGVFGHMLRSNGRVLTDLFVYPFPYHPGKDDSSPSYLIEILNKEQFKPLQMMLKLHKLRSAIEIKEVEMSSWFYYNTTQRGQQDLEYINECLLSNRISKNPEDARIITSQVLEHLSAKYGFKSDLIHAFAVDQRQYGFGMRIITPPSCKLNDFEVLAYDSYLTHRIQNGVVEVSDFRRTATLPFECNLDWMCGINYDKGCYMGQELTIRTFTGNGTTRRVLNVIFDIPIMDISDAFERIELRAIEGNFSHTPAKKEPVFNPFVSSSSSAPVQSRRDMNKVGEILLNNGVEGLARIEKRYFDWDTELSKKVNIVHKGKTYTGTIETRFA